MTKTNNNPKVSAYSEKEMGDVFEQFMRDKRGLPKIGRFSKIFREIDCQQGRPDFIALTGRKPNFLKGQPISVKLAGSLVLSMLHEEAPRTETYLARSTGLSKRSVQEALSELHSQRYIKRLQTGAYVINPARCFRSADVLAIELKLKNAKRAIFQAQQACSFAQRVLIVVPPDQINIYSKYDVVLKRWGIGIASFDPNNNDFVLTRTPRAILPKSRQHQAYAMLQLLDDSQA